MQWTSFSPLSGGCIHCQLPIGSLEVVFSITWLMLCQVSARERGSGMVCGWPACIGALTAFTGAVWCQRVEYRGSCGVPACGI
jgi:hypothetical protein